MFLIVYALQFMYNFLATNLSHSLSPSFSDFYISALRLLLFWTDKLSSDILLHPGRGNFGSAILSPFDLIVLIACTSSSVSGSIRIPLTIFKEVCANSVSFVELCFVDFPTCETEGAACSRESFLCFSSLRLLLRVADDGVLSVFRNFPHAGLWHIALTSLRCWVLSLVFSILLSWLLSWVCWGADFILQDRRLKGEKYPICWRKLLDISTKEVRIKLYKLTRLFYTNLTSAIYC